MPRIRISLTEALLLAFLASLLPSLPSGRQYGPSTAVLGRLTVQRPPSMERRAARPEVPEGTRGVVTLDNTRLPTARTDNSLKVRFSATLGEEPEIELALV